MLPLLVQPFSFDNDVYHAQGWMLSAYGRLPYVGTWDQNFPGIVYLHAGVISVFGTSPVAFRIIDLLLHLAGALLLSSVVRRFFDEQAAIAAGILYTIVYMLGGYWMAGQRDGFASIAFLGALQLYFIATEKPRSANLLMLGSGVLSAVCTTFRPTLFLLAGVIPIALWIYEKSQRKRILYYALGFLIPWLIILFPYFTHADYFRAFADAVFRFNTEVYAAAKFRKSIIRSQEIICDLILLAWAISTWRSKSEPGKRKRRVEVFLFAGLYLCSKLSVILMGKFYVQHYDGLLVLTEILLVGLLSKHHVLNLEKKSNKVIAISAIVLSLVAIYYKSYVPAFVNTVLSGQGAPFHAMHAMHPLWSDYDPDLDDQRIADYLDQHNAVGTQIECCAATPGVYWRSHTSSASRFTTITPLVTKGPTGKYTDLQLEWQREFVDSLRTVKPRFIILPKLPVGFQDYFYHSALDMVDSIAGFQSLLDEQYLIDSSPVGFIVHRRVNE